MLNQQVFEEMIGVYEKSIPEMKLLGELDWCDAARTTRKRITSKLYEASNLPVTQLARECHADLQGYVKTRFGSSVIDAKSCYDKGCFTLYLLSQRLIQIGGSP